MSSQTGAIGNRKQKVKVPGSNYRRNQQIGKVIRVIILLLLCAFALFPVLWVFSASLNPSQSMQNQSFIPDLTREVRADTIGTVEEILVNTGDIVQEGQTVAIVTSSGGNQVELTAPFEARVMSIGAEVGEEVIRSTSVILVEGTLVNLLVNYQALMESQGGFFLRWVFNSMVVSSITAILAVLVTALAAYSFSRFRFYGRQGLLVFILLVQVFPNLLAMVAIFLMLDQLGDHIQILKLGSLGGLVLVYVGGAMGINIWLMKGFFDSVPREIDESAQVDGATHWQTYWMLIFPLVRPILIVVGILSFVGTFNEFVLARVLLRGSRENWTLMVGLWGYIADNFAQNWGIFAAGSVIGALPTLIIYLALQDQIVGGLTQGSVKG